MRFIPKKKLFYPQPHNSHYTLGILWLENVAISNYDECKSLNFKKKIEEPMSMHVTTCSEASIYVNYLVNMHLNQLYVLQVFLIFDEV